MNYTFCSQTSAGRIRSNNEDSVAFDEAAQLGVLADGMGGYNAGEVASSMATTLITAELARWLSDAGGRADIEEARHALEMCVDNANHSIYRAARAHAEYFGMGTTLVVTIFLANQVLVGHVGDSRCYRLREDQFLRITRDHSLLQEQMDAGFLTPEQAALSPLRNLVTRAMGVEDEVSLEVSEHHVLAGDIYLTCSDGLSDMMSDEAIAGVLRNGSDLAQIADRLIAQANENGGRDNITVLLTKASGTSAKRGMMARWLEKP